MEDKLQTYENIIEEANRCLNCKNAKCRDACPLSNDIPTFINELKNNNIEKAYEILRQTSILPEICGSICTKYCEKACILGIKSESISIRDIEKYIANNVSDEKKKEYIKKDKQKTYKIAIIGSGPSGLSCAYYLLKNGYIVDLYEKEDVLGGILKNEIPNYRLEKKFVDDFVKVLIQMGLNINYGYELGNNLYLDKLNEKYHAIFIGIGTQNINTLDIEGKKLKNIYDSKEFLKRINNNSIDLKDKNVCVIGRRKCGIRLCYKCYKNRCKNIKNNI